MKPAILRFASRFASQGGIAFMRLLSHLPLPWVRGLGRLLGWVLYGVAASRRNVVQVNLALCFAHWTAQQRRATAVQTFVYFAQAWLDRGWLWHSSPQTTRTRLRLTGVVDVLLDDRPVVIFAPHFVGLDAGWTALTQQIQRNFTTIYTHQTNADVDEWVRQGRSRFGSTQLFDRNDGPKVLVTALRARRALYLLPDMNYDPKDSVFVPFFGVPAATVTSLSRFARLGRAKVVPVVTRMTASGYDVQVLPAWPDFPSDDVEQDTRLMNQQLETYVNAMPAQYYWVHKRFKDRPDGEKPPY